jgi:hypothetical protein
MVARRSPAMSSASRHEVRNSDRGASRERDAGSVSQSAPSRTAAHLVAVAVVMGVAGMVFAQTRSFGLLGMDTYPVILTSRVESWADFWRTFSEKLMDGLYPGGDFYRPLLNLSFTIDYALWGLRPLGYQLSNVLLFAGCGLALYTLLIAHPSRRFLPASRNSLLHR